MKFIKKYYLVIIPAIIVFIDQLTKLLIKHNLVYGQQVPILKHYFMLTYIENPGIAFGISVGSMKIMLSLLTMIIAAYLIFFLYKHRNEKIAHNLPFVLILAGAIGNLIDRVFYGVLFGYDSFLKGKVIDFIMVDIPDIKLFGTYYDYFPIFNIADSAVTIGVILMLIFSSTKEEKSNQLITKND
jgi:signal peptidase II